ncbi:MAG: TldE/PmbA family protein [Phycisphaerae bacterium]|nr:TldE/PmbA family protein [Phycisphaerae bacterium]
MQEYFHQIADALTEALTGDEVFTASFTAEESDFVRFNHNEIRQAGSVTQRAISLDLIEGQRHAGGQLRLSGDFASDRARAGELIKDLREIRGQVPEDPYLLYATEARSTERREEDRLPEASAAVADIQKAGAGKDLVGLYAGGGIHAGFANSLGQRNWYTNYSFNFDWSFYHTTDKAVKAAYAGFAWSGDEFGRKLGWATEQLAAIGAAPQTVKPGRYRVYLAPSALHELVQLLGWGGFGLKAHRTKQTSLLRMIEGGATLAPGVTVLENTGEGVAPNFQEAGFLKPDRIALIEQGRFRDCLVSPRSAKEYDVPTNGASAHEAPESVDLAAGDLAMSEVLGKLDTGLYVNNLHYLNYSDRPGCRATGMTRFATYWVEHGAIQGPLNVMRFDETIYRALGENLVALTAEREMILEPDTYFQRCTSSARLPGALIEDFSFTL